MIVSVIAAVAENGVIGKDGALPWRLPDDLRRFKALTMGKPIIMGRRTWESIGRPLPGRTSVVLSRHGRIGHPGVVTHSSLDAALAALAAAEEVLVIGGAALYAEAMPRADRLYLTEIHAAVEGDTRFPPWDRSRWRELRREEHPADPAHPMSFSFTVWARRGPEKKMTGYPLRRLVRAYICPIGGTIK